MSQHNEITKRLESEVSRIATSLPTVEWYLFGSIVASEGASSDIDILVVHPTAMDSRIVRAEATALCADFPVHLFVVNDDEQRELDVVASQRCVRIVPT